MTGSPGAPSINYYLSALSAPGGSIARTRSIVQQALDHRGMYAGFAEMAASDAVASLPADGTGGKTSREHATLGLFAWGTSKDYNEQSTYLSLTPVQRRKLQHLTVLSVVTSHLSSDRPTTTVPYSAFVFGPDPPGLRDLEETLVECIYSGLISGKLDQGDRSLHVRTTGAAPSAHRDVRPEDVSEAIRRLVTWSTCAKNMSAALLERAEAVRTDEEGVRNEWVEIGQQAARAKEATERGGAAPFWEPAGAEGGGGSRKDGTSAGGGGGGRHRKGKRGS